MCISCNDDTRIPGALSEGARAECTAQLERARADHAQEECPRMGKIESDRVLKGRTLTTLTGRVEHTRVGCQDVNVNGQHR